MGQQMKLACIGASYKFVRNVVADLALAGSFEDLKVSVMDIDRRSLDIVVGACRALAAAGHSRMEITGTLDRREAVDGADFVLTAIGVGGLAVWQEETRLCLEHGIVHAIGDTIGPAALSKSLRTVPVMLAIARDMEALSPDAWLVNVTNPMTTAVKAVSSCTKTRVIGLCDGSQSFRRLVGDVYGAEPSQVSFDLVGVNHFAFTNRILVNGRDVAPTLYEDAAASSSPSLGSWRLGREIFRLMGGWLPLVEDRHLSEFFPWYVSATDGGKARYGEGPLDLADRMKRRDKLEQDHAALASGKMLPRGLQAYRGEEFHEILAALHDGHDGSEGAHAGGMHVVNVPNGGSCRDLASGTVLEIPALLSRGRVTPNSVPQGTLAPHVVSILNNLGVIHDYTVQAAVTGDMGKARQALLLDPFLQNRDILAVIPSLVEGLFRINRPFMGRQS